MEDKAIVELYWLRDTQAVQETEDKYAPMLRQLLRGILSDREDCSEVLNDCLLRAWNSIPPARPEHLGSYLSKIARNLAIDRFRAANREKRRASEYALSLDELEFCVGENSAEREFELRLLAESIETHLHSWPARSRAAFLGRYYYAESIAELSKRLGMSQGAVKSLLHRCRGSLRTHLRKEGFV